MVKTQNSTGLRYSGCRFKYHQLLEIHQFGIYDSFQNRIKELNASITLIEEEEDTYKFQVRRISKYHNVGTFINCKLSFKTEEGNDSEVLSDFAATNLLCKS